MAEMIAPDQVGEFIRRGRCAACLGRLVVLSDEGGRVVACFSCGREVATVAAELRVPDWLDVGPGDPARRRV